MARHVGRPDPTSQARLQLVLVALAAWNLLAFGLQLVSGPLVEVNDVDGILAGRALGGATAVLAFGYLYAVRNPVRHRFVLWLASIEQFVALFAITFHWARGDLEAQEALLPLAVAAGFLVLLMVNMPRQTDAIAV